MKEENEKKTKAIDIYSNNFLQSIDTTLVLRVPSTCVTLSVTGVGPAVHITSGVGAGLCIFIKIGGKYLKRKEQNVKNLHLLLEHKKTCKTHSKCLEDNKMKIINLRNVSICTTKSNKFLLSLLFRANLI